jgi:hypothetical protein
VEDLRNLTKANICMSAMHALKKTLAFKRVVRVSLGNLFSNTSKKEELKALLD